MRIVIINSEAVPSDLLEFVLRKAGHETVVVSDGSQLRETMAVHTDVVIVRGDESMADGCQRCIQLRARDFTGPIIFVSRQTAMREKVKAFEHGADDYVVEPYDSQEFIARLNAVSRRAGHRDLESQTQELRVGAFTLSLQMLTVTVGSRPSVTLTPTEVKILECLLRSPNITISRETLIERTWGYDFVGASNRLDVNILRLRKKLEADPADPRFLQTVRGVGYVIEPTVSNEPPEVSWLRAETGTRELLDQAF